MKLTVHRDTITLIPETVEERDGLTAIWLKLVPSGGRTKGILPLDEAPPEVGGAAQFRLEGLSLAEKNDLSVQRAEVAMEVYCPICGKTRRLKAGEVIPFCCGKQMVKK